MEVEREGKVEEGKQTERTRDKERRVKWKEKMREEEWGRKGGREEKR